ncbi:MAG: carboxypeptidase-like regulatory domain-containing protein, partial [Bacteroidota bacterium]
MRKTMAVLLALLCCAILARGQNIGSITIGPPEQGGTITDIIRQIEKANNIQFFYKTEWLEEQKFATPSFPLSLQAFLEQTFVPAGIRFFIRDRNVILYPQNYEAINLANSLADDESVVVVGDENAPLDARSKLTGKVTDGQTGEPLPGAVVTIEETSDGAVTDASGNFVFDLYPGLYNMKVNFVGFEESVASIFFKSTGSYDLVLFESSVQLNAVTIEEFAIDQNVNNAQISVTNLDVKTIKSIPAFLGEADIVKSVLLLPGVSTVGEGSTGFNVRGGAVDQNLLIYDNAPIFNSSHLFGFFSNINPDAVRDVTLYKGGIPARYGGRVSSVLEINSRNPSTEKF